MTVGVLCVCDCLAAWKSNHCVSLAAIQFTAPGGEKVLSGGERASTVRHNLVVVVHIVHDNQLDLIFDPCSPVTQLPEPGETSARLPSRVPSVS